MAALRRSARSPLIFVAITALLGGCAVGPDYSAPSVFLRSSWASADKSQSPAVPDLNRWWTRLNDPLLNDLIEEAVVGNLDVATAKARIREARATHDQSVGALFPTIRSADSATRQRVVSSLPSAVTPPQEMNLYQAGFDANWEIDIVGKHQRGVEAAGRAGEAAEDHLDATLLTLIGDIASNYVAIRGFQARIALAQRTATAQRETARLTRERLDAGATSAVDLLNASGLASTTEAAIPSLQVSYAQTLNRLAVLLGRPPGELTPRMKRVAPIPKPRLPLPIGIPADVLVSRPDVRNAERLLAAATARIGAAEAARYPTVSLTGNISTTALNIGDVGKNSTIGWAFGPTLNVPIFNAGRLKAAVEIAQAQRDQTFVAYQGAVLKALEEVENALVSLSQERVRASRLASSVSSYREAASLSRSMYRGGSANFLSVLDAERSLYTAEDALVQSRILMVTSYIALNKALGGGWDGFVDTSRPEVVDVGMGPHLNRR